MTDSGATGPEDPSSVRRACTVTTVRAASSLPARSAACDTARFAVSEPSVPARILVAQGQIDHPGTVGDSSGGHGECVGEGQEATGQPSGDVEEPPLRQKLSQADDLACRKTPEREREGSALLGLLPKDLARKPHR